MYGNTHHVISIELIREVMHVHCGYTTEQFLRGSQPLIKWVNEIIPRGEMFDGYMKLGSLVKN